VNGSARLAKVVQGLRYVSDREPGIRRLRRGAGFVYIGPQGRAIRDEQELARIRRLAIPPAYRDVWISPNPHGHLQATGRDARGRKQYRYHPLWRAHRDGTKFHRMLEFGQVLPRIRRVSARHLAMSGLPREKVLAAIVKLLQSTLVRVGNEEYVRSNGSFGLTTLRDRHVKVRGERLRFEFRGKSGVHRAVSLYDRRLARIIRRCQDLPGHELFQYIDDDGTRHTIGSQDVNDYLRAITGQEITAKDFRTWSGTICAAEVLSQAARAGKKPTRRQVLHCIEQVAARLGNTKAVCRKSYVHPKVIASYLDGSLASVLGRSDDVETGVLKWLRALYA